MDELDGQMHTIKTECRVRVQQQHNLHLLYEKELQQRMQTFQKEKQHWQLKRGSLSERCTLLQKCVQIDYNLSSKLLHEKEKFCSAMLHLLPEWNNFLHRQQIKEVAEVDKKMVFIQKRSMMAELAFEKEKKLFSLLAAQQEQLRLLQHAEKQQAMSREHTRQSMMQEALYNDIETSSCSIPKPTFASTDREQQLRDQITAEIEAKYQAQIDELTQMRQTQAVSIRRENSDVQTLSKYEPYKSEQQIQNEQQADKSVSKTPSLLLSTMDMTNCDPSVLEENDKDMNDTSDIERAVDLLTMSQVQNAEENNSEHEAMQQGILPNVEMTVTAETKTETEIRQSPEQQHQADVHSQEQLQKIVKKTNSKLKKMNTRRVARNRLQFSSFLGSDTDRDLKETFSNLKKGIITTDEEHERKVHTQNMHNKVELLNDFDEDGPTPADLTTKDLDDGSEDDFVF